MKLLPKIVLVAVLPVMLGAGAVLYVLASSWQRTLEDELIESARRSLIARVDLAPAAFHSARESLRLMASSSVLASGDLQQIRSALREWNRRTSQFENFTFSFLDGTTYAADGDRFDISDQEYFPAIRRGEEVLARPLLSGSAQRPGLLVRVPVKDAEGRLRGSLGGTILLGSFLERAVADVPMSSARFVLLDQNGHLLAGGVDGATPLLEKPAVANAPKTAAVADAVMTAVAAEQISPDLKVTVLGETLRVLHVPVPTLSWRLVHAQPEAELLAPLAEARHLALVVIAGTVLAAFLLAALLFGLILRPVNRLNETLQRLRRGERGARALVAGGDEFAGLAASLNAMADTLQSSESRFEAVFLAAPFAVTLTRMSDGTYLDVNPAFERSSGYRREEVLGKTSREAGFSGDDSMAQAQARTLLETGRLDNVEQRGVDRQDNEKWTLYSSRLVELDGESVAISMAADITPLKQVEQALRDSEASFTALFDLAPIPLAYAQDADGYGGTQWNEAWYRVFGYSRDEAENCSGADVGLWVDTQDRLDYLQSALGEGGVSGRPARMRCKSGEIRQVELYGRFFDVGKRRLLMTAYLDVTDARNAEIALRARETWLRSLFEVSPVAVLVVDLQGQIRECNHRFVEMLQCAEDEIVGHSYFDFVHPSHQLQAREGVGRMLTDPSLKVFSAERSYQRKDGSTLLGLLSARRMPGQAGGDDVLLLIISDLSDLRQAEALRIESESKLQAVFNASPAAMIVSDARRNFASVAANDAWERQFLRGRDQFMGMTGAEMGLWASVPDRDHVLDVVRREGCISGFETWLVRGDGVKLMCRISARCVQAGDAELLVMVQEDVTELRRAEGSLQKANIELARQLALSDAVARAQSNFIADAAATGAFESLLADLLQLAESEYGFIGEILADSDGQPFLKTHAITNIAWDDASRRYYEENAQQGLAFRNLNTLFGAAILTGQPVIANDPANDPRRGGLPPGHPAMHSFLGLPVRVGGRLVAMAGVANRPGGYDMAFVEWLHPLLLTIGQMVEARNAALARQKAEQALRELNDALDVRVRERTEALNQINTELSGTLETLRRAQGDLVRSEKLAALGSLVAGVAHELNTPIGNSVTVASTLMEDADSFAESTKAGLKRTVLDAYVASSRRGAQLLLANLQRAANLVTSFKQVAVDQTSEQRRRFDVAEVVAEILDMLHPQLKKRPLEVRTGIPPGLLLDSYPGPFGQVVANLVNNAAIHAFSDGRALGIIRIEAETLPAALGGCLQLTVSDDGVGVPPDHIDRIFDPFFTTRLGQGGSGLGLNIVYNIVTGMLGGKIRVESRPGEGTCFFVQLPFVAPKSDPS